MAGGSGMRGARTRVTQRECAGHRPGGLRALWADARGATAYSTAVAAAGIAVVLAIAAETLGFNLGKLFEDAVTKYPK